MGDIIWGDIAVGAVTVGDIMGETLHHDKATLCGETLMADITRGDIAGETLCQGQRQSRGRYWWQMLQGRH